MTDSTRHECGTCGKQFLTRLQLFGHQSTHAPQTRGDAA